MYLSLSLSYNSYFFSMYQEQEEEDSADDWGGGRHGPECYGVSLMLTYLFCLLSSCLFVCPTWIFSTCLDQFQASAFLYKIAGI